jgi:hypothetical protein
MVLQISLEIDQSMKNDPAAQLRNAEEIFAHCTEHEDSPEPADLQDFENFRPINSRLVPT